MKRLIYLIIIVLFAIPAFAEGNLLVTMPTPPSSLQRLDERCNYIVINYWTTFNPKSSFSNLDGLDATMRSFLDFVPYATADTVYLAIDRLVDAVGKAKPENLVTLAQMAERNCYSDTCEIRSEDVYFPFVRAVAENKKAKGPLRDRYVAQYKQLLNSRIGSHVANLEYTLADGTKATLDSIKADHILLMFYDPDCIDCRLAKARLEAESSFKDLIANNILAIVAVYPDEPTAQWREEAAGMPAEWVVAACPDAEDRFTIVNKPEIYYLDRTHEIKGKGINVDNIINTFSRIRVK